MAVDFVIEDEDMFEVALWVAENTLFDNIYIYERDRPIHVSVGPSQSGFITHMYIKNTKKRIPKTF